MRPDLVSLELFLHAVDTRSLSKAATRSHIALAAASRRIALLEEMLGVGLLDRSSRGVQPTPAGLALVHHARQVLQEVGRLTGELSEYAKGVKGRVRLHSNTSALTQFLPEHLASFSAKFPDIRFDIEEKRRIEIVEAISLGGADVGIVVKGLPTFGLETFPYQSDHLVAVLPKGHPLKSRSVAFEQLLDHDFASLEGDASITRAMIGAAASVNRPLRLRVQVWSFEAMCRMIQAGLGIGILPRKAAEVFSDTLQLRLVPLTDGRAQRQYLLCVREFKSLPAHARRLVEHFTSAR